MRKTLVASMLIALGCVPVSRPGSLDQLEGFTASEQVGRIKEVAPGAWAEHFSIVLSLDVDQFPSPERPGFQPECVDAERVMAYLEPEILVVPKVAVNAFP